MADDLFDLEIALDDHDKVAWWKIYDKDGRAVQDFRIDGRVGTTTRHWEGLSMDDEILVMSILTFLLTKE